MTRTHWRIPVLALLVALLAYLSSFLVSETYQSATRLIIHGRDAAFLSSSGQPDPTQTTITDATSAKALADTYGSIATSRSLAISVVGDLHLDAPKNDSGFVHVVVKAVAWTYKCGRALITSGMCASVGRHEQAIDDVQSGTTAQQLGTTAGDSAGQPGSYVLEISSSGDSPAQAQAITNTLADELVKASTRLVAYNARTFITRLRAQLRVVTTTVNQKTAAITAYERQHDISAADQELAVTASSYADLKAELRDARNDLAEAKAKLASITASLGATAQTTNSDQRIETGRSDTSITTVESNPTYTDLRTAQSQTKADISGLNARIRKLDGEVAGSSPGNLNSRLATLANLQDDLTNARKSQTDVLTQLQSAQTAAATAQPDLARIDQAGRPTYPTSPKRYLYLLIGLLLGALAGGALTWRAERRAGPTDASDGTDGAAAPTADSSAGDGRAAADDDPFELLGVGRTESSDALVSAATRSSNGNGTRAHGARAAGAQADPGDGERVGDDPAC